MTEEKKKLLEKLRSAEAIYVLMSDCTRMPFVECDAETFDDQVFVYFDEEAAKKEAQLRAEEKVRVTKIENKFLLPFFTGLYPMGVNCIVTEKGTMQEASLQLGELVVRNVKEAEKQGKTVVENPELHLTAIYFMQKLRTLSNPQMTDELRELNEEMMAHYMRGRYIVGVAEKNTMPILKQKDGKTLQPIFTDMQEFMKFRSVNREDQLKTAIIEAARIPEIIAKEAAGIVVNPYGINLVLQIPRKPETQTV